MRHKKSAPVLEQVVDDEVAPVLVVEEYVEAPVHEPGALLQLLQHRHEGVAVDQLLQLHQLVQRRVPVLPARRLILIRLCSGVSIHRAATVPNSFSFINSCPASQSCGNDRYTFKGCLWFLNHEREHHSSALASWVRPAPRLSGRLGNDVFAGRLAVLSNLNMSLGSLSISCCMPTQRFALRTSACCLLPDACCTRTADGHSCSDCLLRLLFHNSTRRPATPPLCRSLLSHHPLHELFSHQLDYGDKLSCSHSCFTVMFSRTADLQQDLRGQLAPQSAEIALAIRAERAVMVQELRRRGVVAALKLELCIVIQRVDLVRPNVELLFRQGSGKAQQS